MDALHPPINQEECITMVHFYTYQNNIFYHLYLKNKVTIISRKIVEIY